MELKLAVVHVWIEKSGMNFGGKLPFCWMLLRSIAHSMPNWSNCDLGPVLFCSTL